jgi:hypothetical protein
MPSESQYLMFFAVPPVITAFVLSAIDPMAGMALLTCFVVMALVLRGLLGVERFRREYVPPREQEAQEPASDRHAWRSRPGRRGPADAEPFHMPTTR